MQSLFAKKLHEHRQCRKYHITDTCLFEYEADSEDEALEQHLEADSQAFIACTERNIELQETSE
tara:strand:+ start:2306 stop:2497 length:192 start_codon:yes stop_codon:yes gene_type:complete